MEKRAIFIVGCPKSGTTSFANFLLKDERIFVNGVKESWSLEDVKKVGHFDSKILLDATTWYFSDVRYVNKINELIADGFLVSVVLCLRSPLELLNSLLNFRISRGNEELIEFSSYFHSRDTSHLPLESYQYNYGSLLDFNEILTRWKVGLGCELNVIAFEKLLDDPFRFYQMVCSDLGISPRRLDSVLPQSNQTRYLNEQLIRILYRGYGLSIPVKLKRKWIRLLHRFLGSRRRNYVDLKRSDIPDYLLVKLDESFNLYKSLLSEE